MALFLKKAPMEDGEYIVVTCESEQRPEEVALEWESRLGFCFRMRADVAAEFVEQIKSLLAGEDNRSGAV